MNNDDVQYINEIGCGYWKSQVLFVAVEFDVFTLIGDGGKSGKVITKKLGTNPRATEMLMNALVSLKLLKKSKEIYCNTAVSKRCLSKNSPFHLNTTLFINKQPCLPTTKP